MNTVYLLAPVCPVFTSLRTRWLLLHLYVVGAVAIGGAIGGSLRYGLMLLFPYDAGSVPYVIASINIAGAFVLGMLGRWIVHAYPEYRLLRVLLTTGLLGAFTTFSTYALDLVFLVDAERVAAALAYVAVSLGGGIAAALMGLFVAERMLRRTSSQST